MNNKNLFSYIHIPFCTSKCKYCRFASFGTLESFKVNLYVSKLINEIKKTNLSSFDLNKKGILLNSIYFGGGTPSILSINDLDNIIKEINKKIIFSDNIEINIEATPVTINKKNLQGWHNIGISRLSCGVQTLNNSSLIEIGRGEKGDIINSLNCIKEYLLKNIWNLNMSIDFIIGLPYVKKGEIKKNIEFILKEYDFIKHVSVYMLEEYYDIPKEVDSNFDNITYPNNWNKLGIKEDEYLTEYIEIKEFLKNNGFNSYEISNFAKKGYECKHNKSYWNHSKMLAFGLGAHGFNGTYRYSNSESFSGYYSGKKDSEKLINNDLFIEKMMFQLRTSGLTEEVYNKLNLQKIEEFIKTGYLQKKSNKIILLDRGVLVLDYILSEIL